MLEGVPFALGGVSSAHILNDNHIATSRCLQTKVHSILLVIWRTFKEDRKRSFRRWTPGVGVKRSAITNLAREFILKLHHLPYDGHSPHLSPTQNQHPLTTPFS